MIVKSPKTEHHEGHAERVVPIFTPLMPYLQAAFDEAAEGETRVVTLSKNNLQRNLMRIIRRADVEVYSKPFHTLRSSCQTELVMTFPDFAVAKWLGNSVRVADRHYLRMTDDLMKRAAGVELQAAHNAAHNAAQSASEPTRNEQKPNGSIHDARTPQMAENIEKSRDSANGRGGGRTLDQRLKRPLLTDDKDGNDKNLHTTPSEGGTESGTLDAEIARLKAHWPTLKQAVREQILHLAESSTATH